MRLTRTKDKFECRIDSCPMEDYLEDNLGINIYNINEDVCTNCPFEKYINKLAEYEDKYAWREAE